MRALFWSAVLNGLAAVPLMVAMMVVVSRHQVMGRFTASRPLLISRLGGDARHDARVGGHARDLALTAANSLHARYAAHASHVHQGRGRIATAAGQPLTFITALAVIVIWAVTGPIFHYSDTWQLIINTGTTIITFLMVFLIQNSQNRDGAAMQASSTSSCARWTRHARSSSASST